MKKNWLTVRGNFLLDTKRYPAPRKVHAINIKFLPSYVKGRNTEASRKKYKLRIKNAAERFLRARYFFDKRNSFWLFPIDVVINALLDIFAFKYTYTL